MAKTKHGLPETKGQFKLRGFVTGMGRDNTYTSKETKTKKERRVLNFGVQTAPESTVYVTVQGMEQKEVFFSKRSEVKGQPGELKRVPFADRKKNQGEGFNLIGLSVGIDKDAEGKNIVKHLHDFDAAEELYNKLNDEDQVFIQGGIEYSSFKNEKDEVRRNKKFVVNRIYNAKDIDFESEKFEETSDFKQKIIFMGIKKVEDKDDPRFEVEAKIVTYNSVEDADFIIRNTSLANTFRSQLKPYNAIEVWGKIFNKLDADEVPATDKKASWGEEDKFKRVNNTYIRELVITGADPETLDVETYTEEIIDEAMKALKEFGESNQSAGNNAWGDSSAIDISDEDLPW
ncbi:hypothetical protein [Bacillus sp. T33-2]|uniref:hypothetical protein n=1 Tax=Bacillus sp. T33-2 TaxID=2054168 RepID=UPI000C7790B6|nr:hypothetical protein [Bacillus sp. T33-2]PLR99522.1 hypothetical protein CVD19_00230 [Bacillus sp. T33-2]